MKDVLKFGKKLFTFSVVAMTLAWSLGLSMVAPLVANAEGECPAVEAGDLVKVAGKATVYVISSDLKRQVIPDEKVFYTWYKDFSSVKIIAETCLSQFPLTPYYLTFRPGSMLVKSAEAASVYAVLPGGELAHIANEQVAAALYGANWYKSAVLAVVPDTKLASYPDNGKKVSSATPHDGMLLKRAESTQVFYVTGGKLVNVEGALSKVTSGAVRTVSEAVISTLGLGVSSVTEANILTQGAVVPTTPVVTGSVSVSLSAVTPVATTLATGSAFNPVLNVNLSAGSQGATVTALTLTRGGLLANTKIAGVSVWDGSTRLGNIMTSLTSDGKVTVAFPNGGLSLGANQMKTLTVKANLLSGSYSGTVNFVVAAASDVAGATATGSFPVTGNTMSVVDGSSSLANVYVNDVTVAGLAWSGISSATGNVDVGNTDREVGKFSLQQENSLEAIQLEALTVYVEGSIQDSDLANWKLYSQEGTLLATTAKSSDKYVTFNLTTPYMIDKGLSRNFSVHTDVMDGANRYFRLSVQNDYDVMVKGVTTKSYVMPLDSSGGSFDSADTQNANGGFLVRQGALSVTKSSTSPSTKLAPGSQSAVLAKFDLKSNGEQMEVRKMRLYVTRPTTALTGSVTVRDAETGTVYLQVSATESGLQGVATPSDASTDLDEQNLSTYINIPSGATKTIEVVGTLSSLATASDTYKVWVGSFYVKRLSTNDYTTLPSTTAVYGANQLGVEAVTLAVTKDNSYANSTKTAGTTVKLGQFNFRASSADKVRVNGLTVGVSGSAGPTVANGYSAIQNLVLKNETTGAPLGNVVSSPSAANSFSFTLDVNADETVKLAVYADVLSGLSSGNVVATINSGTVSGYGVVSNKTLDSVPSADVTGQTVTVGSPSITIKADANRATSKILTAGLTDVELNKINLEATNEDLTLSKITLELDTPSTTAFTTSSVAANFAKVYLYDGSTKLGESTVESGTDHNLVTFSGLNVTLTASTQKVLTVKVDLTGSGTLYSKSVVRAKVYSNSNTYMEVFSSTGLMSAGSITLTSNAAGNYMLLTDTAPTIAFSGTTSESKTPSASDIVGQYTVTNSGARPLTLTTMNFAVSASGLNVAGTVTSFKLYDTSGTQIGTTDSTIVSSTAATATITFSSLTEEISAGSAKTFVLKANTSDIRDGLTTSNAYLNTKVAGDKGYIVSDVTGSDELYWNDGVFTYSYTRSNSLSTVTGANATDSVDVIGTTYKY
ncbi:MAG: hypothetical protein PHQ18_03340 [Patescibacteria group bacterium]|nr:hypothetical protein [Patescibacteria group bacterium]